MNSPVYASFLIMVSALTKVNHLYADCFGVKFSIILLGDDEVKRACEHLIDNGFSFKVNGHEIEVF